MLVATTGFRDLAAEVAATLGLPGMRIVAVGHPLGGTDEATVIDWADAAVNRRCGCSPSGRDRPEGAGHRR